MTIFNISALRFTGSNKGSSNSFILSLSSFISFFDKISAILSFTNKLETFNENLSSALITFTISSGVSLLFKMIEIVLLHIFWRDFNLLISWPDRLIWFTTMIIQLVATWHETSMFPVPYMLEIVVERASDSSSSLLAVLSVFWTRKVDALLFLFLCRLKVYCKLAF